MTLEELEKYPNVLDALRTHYTNKLEDSIKQTENIPDDFKEMLKETGITDNTIVSVINENPAALFYFFDDRNIYINITGHIDGTFIYTIIEPDSTIGSHKFFNTRKEAESVAIDQSIKRLEIILTNSVSDKENS